jgi:hypothetical protein
MAGCRPVIQGAISLRRDPIAFVIEPLLLRLACSGRHSGTYCAIGAVSGHDVRLRFWVQEGDQRGRGREIAATATGGSVPAGLADLG